MLQPAREAGLRFEVDTVRALPLDEVIRQTAARDPGSLPLLSFVLDQLWRRRTDRGVLTFEAYADLGGLEGALGRRAEEVFAALPAEVQAALPTLLRALVAIGRASGPTVCAKPASITQFPPGTPARTLIDAFLHPQARLLVADDTHIRVAHEALLSHWPRAREQVAADSRDLELLGRLENGAERWQAANIRHRDGLVLPKGLLLTEAVDLMRRWGTELPGAVLDFIKRSRSVAKRRRMRMALAMSGAIVLLPVIAAIVWTIMVWRGVQAVEGTMAFVQIPKGCFEMGAPLGEEGRFDHETPHNVCVSAFELGKYAITQDEWLQVMVESPDPARYKGGRNPIEMISWHDARSFTRRMNLFGKHQYRLPTEAEWDLHNLVLGQQARGWLRLCQFERPQLRARTLQRW